MILQLLGVPQRIVNGNVIGISLRRSYWLLFYLAYYQSWIRREDLILFLRPDLEREGGSLYLRQLLTEVRKLPWTSTLEIETDRLRWQVETDIEYFRQAAAAGRWFEAIELYRGPFLSGLNASYLPTYETWLDSERASLAQAWRDVVLHHVSDLQSSNHHREAAALAKKLHDYDNLDEEALHSYLRNAYQSGQRYQALQVANAFVQNVRDEFALEPTAATLELIESITLGRPLVFGAVIKRYGRRKSDRLKVASEKAEHVQAILETLKAPNTRLLSISAADGKQANLLITSQVSDIEIALSAIVAFAEEMIAKKHNQRALELLMQVWNHPSTKQKLKDHVASLCSELGVQFPLY